MFVAWRELRFARGRFTLIGGVIVLITLLVGLLSGLTAGLARESTSAVTGLAADHLVFSRTAETFTDSSVPETSREHWADRPGVEVVEPVGLSPATATTGDRSGAVTVIGVVPGGVVSGLSAEVAAGRAVLSAGAADALDATAGDSVSVAGASLTVEAVEGDASYSHTPVVWTSLADWQRLSGRGGSVTVLALQTGDGFRAEAAQVRSIDESLAAIGSYSAENGSLRLIRGFLFVIAAVVVGAFFTVWTIQRSGDVAVLKALGASNRYLLRDALGQATVLLLVGSALGAGLAVLLGAVARGAVPFQLDPATIGPPVLGMVALGLLGAALSVRRITSVDPLTALGSAR